MAGNAPVIPKFADTENNPLLCPFDDCSYPKDMLHNGYVLRDHFLAWHKERIQENGAFYCPFEAQGCNAGPMKQYGGLKTHLNRHLSLLPYQCPHSFGMQEPHGPPDAVATPCPFRTSDPAHLTRHREMQHAYVRAHAKAAKKKKTTMMAKQAQADVLVPQLPATFLPPQWNPPPPAPHTVTSTSTAASITFQIPVLPPPTLRPQQNPANVLNSRPPAVTTPERVATLPPAPQPVPLAPTAPLSLLLPPQVHGASSSQQPEVAPSLAIPHLNPTSSALHRSSDVAAHESTLPHPQRELTPAPIDGSFGTSEVDAPQPAPPSASLSPIPMPIQDALHAHTPAAIAQSAFSLPSALSPVALPIASLPSTDLVIEDASPPPSSEHDLMVSSPASESDASKTLPPASPRGGSTLFPISSVRDTATRSPADGSVALPLDSFRAWRRQKTKEFALAGVPKNSGTSSSRPSAVEQKPEHGSPQRRQKLSRQARAAPYPASGENRVSTRSDSTSASHNVARRGSSSDVSREGRANYPSATRID